MKTLKASKATLLATLVLVSLNAHALFDPNWERPIERVQLEITETHRGFELVDELEVTLRKRDGALHPTSMLVKYNKGMGEMLPAFETIKEEYFISEDNVSKDDCGSVYYSVTISDHDEAGRSQGARSTVTLIDHRERVCTDLIPDLIEFRMRKGYGWCGTMDATLEAIGKPEALYSAYIK